MDKPPGVALDWDDNCESKVEGDTCEVKCDDDYTEPDDSNDSNIFTCDNGVFTGTYTCVRGKTFFILLRVQHTVC